MNLVLELFLTFLKIGLFTFGGGYAMISIIENNCVEQKKWITHDEMMNITVIAESTPGPIAINCATFVGYKISGLFGAIAATFGVVLPSFILMIAISKFFLKYQKHPMVESVFKGLRPAVVGLLAAASLVLMTSENFGNYQTDLYQFIVSVIIFLVAFIGTRKFKVSPILMIALCGLAGFLLY